MLGLALPAFRRHVRRPKASVLNRETALLGIVVMYDGFPGGALGATMVFLWSVFLGLIRHRSGGMVAPLVVHFFADLTIALIVLFLIVLAR